MSLEMLTTISLQRYNKQKDMKGSGMKKIIYHGSQNIIDNPQFGKGARNNDFGRGFYCTENIELAKEWACAKDTDGFANVYQLDMDGLRVLNLNDGKYSILNWLAVLTSNRTYWQRKSIAELEKNYLNDKELDMLNRIVSLYLDFAELQALEENVMTMNDWVNQLDYFLKMSRKDILEGKGAVSHEQALLHAREEYTKFKNRLLNNPTDVEKRYLDGLNILLSYSKKNGE